MGPDLWELFEDGKEDDEVAAIIRLGHYAVVPKGVRVVTQFSEIITVRMKRGDVLRVSGAPEVASMIAGDAYLGADLEIETAGLPELSSDTILPSDERRPKDVTATGRGVVVGVVDWGFDFAHPDFRNKDGSSRIIALWDQRGSRRPASPQPFGYGIVHDRVAIDRALKSKDPYAALGYHPADADTGIGCHGTHVASIAAGSGGEDRPTGIAPEADLVLVHNAPWDEVEPSKLGDSVTLLEGIDFISRTAGDRPWVINLSMGRHGEQHDGSTLIEQGLDAAIRSTPGRAVCLSAGNYYDKKVHASGQLRPTQERTLDWEILEGKPTYNQMEFWYSWQDKFELAVRSPDGTIAARVKVGERAKFLVGGKEVGNVYHRSQEPNSLDNHITLYLYKEAATGTWQVTLIGTDVIDGRYHAWIERDVTCPRCQSHFHPDDADPRSTTGTICNGRRTIAVGAFDSHDPEKRIGRFSSVGPTRDLRLKPDLCAPGVSVLAARSAPRNPNESASLLTRMSGTSMAAPHVTGTVALMFQSAPRRLRIEETHNLLLENTRRLSEKVENPDRYGIGFLDIEAVVEAARKIGGTGTSFKQTTVQTPGTVRTNSGKAESVEQEIVEAEVEQEAFEARAEAEFEFEGAEGDANENTFHRIANDITSAFEGGRPGTLNLYDRGIISYGKHQATLASGTLYPILRRFTELSAGDTASKMSSYLNRVKRKDESLREDSEFIRLLKDAAKESAMDRAQDEEFTRQYWEPAKRRAAASNIKTALGHAIFYDTKVQGGLDQVQKKTEARLGGKAGDTIGGKQIGEQEALRAFMEERIQRHFRISANQRKLSEDLSKEARELEDAAATDPERAETLRERAAEKRKKAKQNAANAAALVVSANKTRGPSLMALVESGDLDLYDGDERRIYLKGKSGVAIASLSPGAAVDSTTSRETESVSAEVESTSAKGDCDCREHLESDQEFEAGVSDTDSLFAESLAEEMAPEGAGCSAVAANCLTPPKSDLDKIRPKGKPEGAFIDRTEGDRSVNFVLHLTDYDVNAYVPNKAQHREALVRIREFIVKRSTQTKDDIAVTITGSASRTGGKDYNDALSCKRAQCVAQDLQTSLSFFAGVPQRVKINSAGEGFLRATCKGKDCELAEFRSVLVQVHTPDNPPAPVPIPVPGWDKYRIRCCSFKTRNFAVALLDDLLKKGLDPLPKELRGTVLDLVRKGLKELVKRLQKALPALERLAQGLEELMKLFPAELIRETGVFEIQERDKPNPLTVILCYSGVGLRIPVPREKVDEFLDDIINKTPGLKLLPDLVKKQIREQLKKAIPGIVKTLIQPVESDTPGPFACFDLTHPRTMAVFAGSVQIGTAFFMPGRVNVEFDSPPWHSFRFERPVITNCKDTECTDSGVQTIVGLGQGLELFSIAAGEFKSGACVCAVSPSAELVEMADQVVRQAVGRLEPVTVLHEVFERVGRGSALTGRDEGSRLTAAEIFDSFVYSGRPALRNQLEQNFEVVELPGRPLNQELREGDVLVRRAEGDVAHVSVIAAPKLRNLEALLSEGMIPESLNDGKYAHVVETGVRPHSRSDEFARQLTDSAGRLLNDILLLRLATPSPVIAVQQPSRPEPEPIIDTEIAGTGLRGFSEYEEKAPFAQSMERELMHASGLGASEKELVSDGFLAEPASSRSNTQTFLGLDTYIADGNKVRDWMKAKADGQVSFGFFRSNWGVFTDDPTFTREWRKMREAGIVRGAYLFLRFPNPKADKKYGPAPAPTAQANAFIKTVGKLDQSDFPPAFDVEFPGDEGWKLTGLTHQQLLDGVRATWKVLKDHYGVAPIIYTSARVWEEDLNDLPAPDLAESPLWLAQYCIKRRGTRSHDCFPTKRPVVGDLTVFTDGRRDPLVPPPWGDASNWWIHQHQGDALNLPGFATGNVDMNRFNTMLIGARGTRVKWVQRRLGIAQNGMFDVAMESELREFQAKRNLAANGMIDPRTFAFLCWSNP
jgi:GH25 family lysozyme M1 (1,4-beta-N-acetylmuramidase)/subtilisin family serine protease/outer membrane protein OmpA-like peptidoglycan-associated protein